jgi:hypothetical protein
MRVLSLSLTAVLSLGLGGRPVAGQRTVASLNEGWRFQEDGHAGASDSYGGLWLVAGDSLALFFRPASRVRVV